MKPNITFYVIILPALLLFTSIYAQTWSWEWSVLDIQISPGEERLRNSCLAFHLLDEPSPRFVYESGDRLLMVHDINPDPENHYWAVDSSFFDIFSTFHQQNFSPRWYATGEDSTVRLSCLTFVSADSAYHFSSYTRNAYLPHSQWNEDIGMRYSFVEEDTMRYYRGYGGWIPVHADIDNDGDLDWIVCSGNNANIIRFINEIDYWRPMLLISTKPIVPYSSTQWDVNHFTTVDLDNDHLPELVVTYSLSGWELIRTNQYALYCSDLYQEEMQISRLKGPVENVGWISQLDLDNDGNFEIFATDDNSMVQWEAVLDGSVYKLDKKILWSSPENVEAVWCDNTSRKVRAIITADVYEEIDRASHEGEHDFHYFFDYWQYDQISDDWNWRGRINEEAI
ncbi:MAG: VCBS repeat-containing protein, partial [Candidatus Electryonea clarkiae]|nr:VCBS repeat-containing protein [Candidatus Electryonea clarkiae]